MSHLRTVALWRGQGSKNRGMVEKGKKAKKCSGVYRLKWQNVYWPGYTLDPPLPPPLVWNGHNAKTRKKIFLYIFYIKFIL